MNRHILTLVVTVACLTLLAGCGDDGGTDVKITPPTVTQTSPQDGATGVSLVPRITVSFSEEMDATTLTGISVTGVATHHVDYDTLGNEATVYISEALAAETAYEVTVPASVKDAEGHSLGTAYTFGFTSGPLDCDNAADYFEPNNAANQTSDIRIPCTFPVLSSCGTTGEKDYYSFTVDEATKVTFRLQRVDGGPAVHWISGFQRGALQIFALSDSLRSGEDVSDYFTFLPGTYVLRVGKQDEDEEIVFYSLTIETSDPCPDDEYEDNDFSSEAAVLTAGRYENLRGCYRDIDNYMVNLSAGQTLTVTADNITPGVFEGGLFIYNHDFTDYSRDVGTHNPLSVARVATESGYHYVSITWTRSEVTYHLDIEVD